MKAQYTSLALVAAIGIAVSTPRTQVQVHDGPFLKGRIYVNPTGFSDEIRNSNITANSIVTYSIGVGWDDIQPNVNVRIFRQENGILQFCTVSEYGYAITQGDEPEVVFTVHSE